MEKQIEAAEMHLAELRSTMEERRKTLEAAEKVRRDLFVDLCKTEQMQPSAISNEEVPAEKRTKDIAQLIGTLRIDPNELAEAVVKEGGNTQLGEVKAIYLKATQEVVTKLLAMVTQPAPTPPVVNTAARTHEIGRLLRGAAKDKTEDRERSRPPTR